METSIETLKELVKSSNGPLKKVEEIKPLEPIYGPCAVMVKRKGFRRGPKPQDLWVAEIGKDRANINEIDILRKSWLAALPRVLKLAKKYGGGLSGRGEALKELLTQAIIEARKCATDEKTHAMLMKYPGVKITVIAKGRGISREQFSRQYRPKAFAILTEQFQRLIDRKPNSQAYQKSV